MDPRVREHAATIADHSTDIQEGDNVVILAPSIARDLVTALHEEAGNRNANPVVLMSDSTFRRAYLTARGGDFQEKSHKKALIEAADVIILVRGERNAAEMSGVDPEVISASRKANEEILQERLRKRWCLTQYPAQGNAQRADMRTDEYRSFVWDAINKDWEEQRRYQAKLVDILEETDTIRITSGDETDIEMSIAGNAVQNDFAEQNLPGGEVYTAPVVDSVNGTVLFDKPLIYNGREISDIYLEFEDGIVSSYSAEINESLLETILTTDEGSDKLGEVGFGMNSDITEFTYNMLFDEKMTDSIHLALGNAYEDTVGDENTRNDSAIHQDMIVDMSDDSSIRADGDVIQKNGTFVFE